MKQEVFYGQRIRSFLDRLEQARTRCGLTQEELAQKCGTNKSYISRIENDASDIKLSTLIKIVPTGLGGHLKLVLPK
jgi:transcriptional regulator with XRE-family HTH domain